MDGEIASDPGECARCGRDGIVLLDGVLCERCHPEVWASYEDTITRFGLLRQHDGGELEGELVAAGIASTDRAVLAWLHGPTSAEVYASLDEVQSVYQDRENLRIVYS